MFIFFGELCIVSLYLYFTLFFPLLCFRLESSFRSFSRPVLHAAARVVQEMGKSRAAAFALGIQDIDEGVHVNAFSDNVDSLDLDSNENPYAEGCLLYYSFIVFSSGFEV